MIKSVIKKMLNNFWLVFSLLVGCIIVTSMISCIPMYTDGILQRMLTRDLEIFQTENNIYPGNYPIEISAQLKNDYMEYDKIIMDRILPEIQLPIVSESKGIILKSLEIVPEKQREDIPKQLMRITSLTEIEEHINVTNGKIYSDNIEDGVIEAVVTHQFFKEKQIRLNETYIIKDLSNILPYKIKIVGVFENKENDAYWIENISSYKNNLFINDDLLYKEFMDKGKGELFLEGKWNVVFNYHLINIDNLESIVGVLEDQTKWFESQRGIKNDFVSMEVLQKYTARSKQLVTTLWILSIPVIFVMMFYIFMTSQLIIKSEQNEIAVLKSRGASRYQILKIYFVESLILCIISIIIGPFIGVFLCKIIGASTGFLTFASRKALHVNIEITTYLYCAVVLLVMMITMMIPAYRYSKTTIVQHKQHSKKRNRVPIWQKTYLDVIIICLSLYGLYTYRRGQSVIELTGVKGTEMPIDPLVFLASTLFILGAGLIFLRIFPFIVKLIFFLGKKVWSPSAYMSFIQVSRSKGQEQFIMLFLVFVMSVGIFSANAARTINKNIEDRIKYEIGSDISLQDDWGVFKDSPLVSMGFSDKENIFEPPFSKYLELSGVKSATKVYTKSDGEVITPRSRIDNVNIMGVIPHEFGEIAWFRNDLLPYHIYAYLNTLSSTPNAVLVSTNMKNKFKLALGESVNLMFGDEYAEGIVSGFIDYWPTYNPHDGYLVVGNLNYFHDNVPMEPYKVWIKKDIGIKDEIIYKEIEDNELNLLELKNPNQEIIKKRNDPMLQGINGLLTLAFLITMLISFVGFLIYWILSIYSRVLQFGILRALGLPLKKIIMSIVYEQILISGTALIGGVIIGGIASDLFVPLFELVFSAVPPFQVVSSRDDYTKIYIIIVSMIIIGLGVLRKIISHIDVGQALRLGED